ncbi:hypothetical protein MNB_SV-10-1206 [hydrothermal vent metagenome]|uniref:Uncharacterized protein n=1 Tax=hydrothermal vent metagenome TaxID=652676 RepID=A0A1W1C1I8_9ZZZZ
MVCLQSVFDSSEDLQCFVDARFVDFNRLETSLECRIFLEVLSVLLECCGTNGMEFTTCQCRLENIGSIHASLTRTRTDNSMDLIDEKDDVTRFLDFVDNCFESVLKFTSVLRTGDETAHIE